MLASEPADADGTAVRRDRAAGSLLALARDDRVASASAVALGSDFEARLSAVDAALAQLALTRRRLELWRERVSALRAYAGLKAPARAGRQRRTLRRDAGEHRLTSFLPRERHEPNRETPCPRLRRRLLAWPAPPPRNPMRRRPRSRRNSTPRAGTRPSGEAFRRTHGKVPCTRYAPMVMTEKQTVRKPCSAYCWRLTRRPACASPGDTGQCSRRGRIEGRRSTGFPGWKRDRGRQRRRAPDRCAGQAGQARRQDAGTRRFTCATARTRWFAVTPRIADNVFVWDGRRGWPAMPGVAPKGARVIRIGEGEAPSMPGVPDDNGCWAWRNPPDCDDATRKQPMLLMDAPSAGTASTSPRSIPRARPLLRRRQGVLVLTRAATPRAAGRRRDPRHRRQAGGDAARRWTRCARTRPATPPRWRCCATTATPARRSRCPRRCRCLFHLHRLHRQRLPPPPPGVSAMPAPPTPACRAGCAERARVVERRHVVVVDDNGKTTEWDDDSVPPPPAPPARPPRLRRRGTGAAPATKAQAVVASIWRQVSASSATTSCGADQVLLQLFDRLAPRITVDTGVARRNHAIASGAGSTPSSRDGHGEAARAFEPARALVALQSCAAAGVAASCAMRESAGRPPNTPGEQTGSRGDHVVVPMPYWRYNGVYSRSTVRGAAG